MKNKIIKFKKWLRDILNALKQFPTKEIVEQGEQK